jgi:hypothetical protein
MVDYYGLGVLTPGMGIFHLIFSYSGKITLSVLADRDIMPDPEFYHDCLVATYEELYAAATKLSPGRPKSAAVAAKAKIRSPKRKRAGTNGRKKPVPKLHAKNSATTRSAKTSSSGKKRRKMVKTGTVTTSADARSAAAKRQQPSTPTAAVATTRLKATRRETNTPTPKLSQ